MPIGTPTAIADQRRDADEHDVLAEERANSAACVRQKCSSVMERSPIAGAAAPRRERGAGLEERLEERTHTRVRRPRNRGRRVEGGEHAVGEHADPVASANASAMSCVTRTTVFRTCSWMRRNSRCISARVTGIERAERLVHQQDRRIGRQRARHADALTLAARQFIRPAPRVLRRLQPDQRRAARRHAPRSRPSSHPSSRGTTAMFSAMLMCGNSPTSCIT